MFGKDIKNLDYQDIVDLVQIREEQEGHNLDYKENFSTPKKAPNYLAKHISSFANSSGGFLIIGIDDNLVIKGIDKTFNNKPLIEWVNQVLSGRVEPQVFYRDPIAIEIPNSDKIVLVFQVPESSRKPHMVKEDHAYYIRANDSTKKATHGQVRDMFEYSRNRKMDFEEFLIKRNLKDSDHDNFGKNKNTQNLVNPFTNSTPKPHVLFSIIPKYPKKDLIKVPQLQLARWLDKNSIASPANGTSQLYSNGRSETKFDGLIYRHTERHDNIDYLGSYFEVLTNGYAEFGGSSGFFEPNFDHQMKGGGCNKFCLTPLLHYDLSLLSWVKSFYNFIGYNDEVYFSISLINIENLCLSWPHDKFDLRRNPQNKNHKNIQINDLLNPNDLNPESIRYLVQKHSMRICSAFGLSQDFGFKDNAISSLNGMDLLYPKNTDYP